MNSVETGTIAVNKLYNDQEEQITKQSSKMINNNQINNIFDKVTTMQRTEKYIFILRLYIPAISFLELSEVIFFALAIKSFFRI